LLSGERKAQRSGLGEVRISCGNCAASARPDTAAGPYCMNYWTGSLQSINHSTTNDVFFR